jgi:protein phosphatase
MNGKMDCCGDTHVGVRRATNEDQFLIAELNKSMRVLQTSLGLDHQTRMFGTSQGKLMVVADGMGGHEAGERASQLAVDSVVTYVLNTMQWFFRFDAENDQEVREELCASLLHCQKMLADEVDSLPQRHGMGTTLTMAYLLWPRLYLVHVGDSRCYLLRGGKLRQITRDHTLAQLSKEASGETDPDADEDEGPQAKGSNSLWNVISASDDHLSPEIYTAELQLGDVLLLCTDGLYKHVRRQRLAEVLQSGRNSQQICQALIDEANNDGGSDNITVVAARFCEVTGDECEDTAHASDELEIALGLEEHSKVRA